MGLRIATNIPALVTDRILADNAIEQSKSFQRLASGERITRAADDASGLAISELLRAQIRSLGQAERNANDGISFVQVAEGGMKINNILIRLRELGVQAASDTIGDREREYINEEAQSLVEEADRIANVTSYQGVPLLNGEAENSLLEIQVGIRNDERDRISFDTSRANVRPSTLGIDGIDFESVDSARESLDQVDEAMAHFFGVRASLGALQNKLQSAVRTASVNRENLTIARSRITDTDLAFETTELVRRSVLQATGVSVLAQANAVPAQVLKLV